MASSSNTTTNLKLAAKLVANTTFWSFMEALCSSLPSSLDVEVLLPNHQTHQQQHEQYHSQMSTETGMHSNTSVLVGVEPCAFLLLPVPCTAIVLVAEISPATASGIEADSAIGEDAVNLES